MAFYCAGCGHSLAGDARFCSACGKPVVDAGSAALPRGLLVRTLAGRKIAGVCQGFAQHYGWDATLLRVMAILFTIAVFPVGLVVYLMLWVIVPQEAQTALEVPHLHTTS